MQRKVSGIRRPFVFCYFFNKEHNYRTIVEDFARKNKLQIVGVSDN